MINSAPPPRTAAPAAALPRPLRVGYLALTDAAPFVVAQENGFFRRHGIRVELRREIGWATIREKIIYGELDAAHALAPMLWSAQLGLGCPPCEVLTALVLSLNGNAITLSRALREAGVRDLGTLREHARTVRQRQPLNFGVVFPWSSHHLLLRAWLQSGGIDPDRDVRIVIVPPAQMFRNLAAGTIDGYCAGEPWNSLAVRENVGWCPAWSASLEPGHVEKVLMVSRRFAESRAAEHGALVRALAEAAAWCDEPQHREPLAELLGGAAYLNLPGRVIAPALLGAFACDAQRIESVPDFISFHRRDAGVPAPEKAAALQRALASAGLLPAAASADTGLPQRLFRADLHREFLSHTLQHHDLAST